MDRIDPSNLSPETLAAMREVGKKDGNVDDLSTLDLLNATDQELGDLTATFTADRHLNEDEQALYGLMQGMATDLVDLDSAPTYKSYDFALSDVEMPAFTGLPAGSPRADADSALATQLGLNSGTQEASTPRVRTRWNPDYIAAPTTHDAGAKARETLAETYGFSFDADSHEWFSAEQLTALKPMITADNLPDVMHQYMTGLYEHVGKGTDWLGVDDSAGKRMAFGNGDHLPTLPDGRRGVDCQYFALLGQSVFEQLVPPDRKADSFYMPIQLAGAIDTVGADKSVTSTAAGHEIALMVLGDQAYVVDNNLVTPLPLHDMELDDLRTFRDEHPGGTGGVEVPKDSAVFQMLNAHLLVDDQFSRVDTMHYDDGRILSEN